MCLWSNTGPIYNSMAIDKALSLSASPQLHSEPLLGQRGTEFSKDALLMWSLYNALGLSVLMAWILVPDPAEIEAPAHPFTTEQWISPEEA